MGAVGAVRAVVVLLWLQKVVQKPENPLQSAETSAFFGTWVVVWLLLAHLKPDICPKLVAFEELGAHLGGVFDLGELGAPFVRLVPFCLFAFPRNSLAFSCVEELKSTFS